MSNQTAMPLLSLTVEAGEAMSKHRFVDFDGNIPAAGEACIGVTRDACDSGDFVAVECVGISLIEAAAEIAKGAAIETDATGKAVTQTTGVLQGYALDAASADGNIIRMIHRGGGNITYEAAAEG